jgi:hypothetical protein
MIRFLLRFAGMCLLALAFIFIIYDGIRSISGNSIQLTTVSYVWSVTHENSLQGFQAVVERTMGADAWRIGVAAIMSQPAAAIFAVLSLVLIVLGRKKKRLIGYARD